MAKETPVTTEQDTQVVKSETKVWVERSIWALAGFILGMSVSFGLVYSGLHSASKLLDESKTAVETVVETTEIIE